HACKSSLAGGSSPLVSKAPGTEYRLSNSQASELIFQRAFNLASSNSLEDVVASLFRPPICTSSFFTLSVFHKQHPPFDYKKNNFKWF
ncbi:hypothetical protein V1478_012906, partial [Vespula squamosa]